MRKLNTTYDLIVIGTGVAGNTVAHKAQKEGWEVAIIDESSYGGTCPQRGCDPKRVLAGISEIYDDAKRVNGLGLSGDVTLQWSSLQAFVGTFTAPVPEQVEMSFHQAGIHTYHGKAVFVDPYTIQVGEENITAQKIVIATGASATPLPIEGSEHLVTSDQFFELNDLPERIIFVGGGYISFEFAHLCARLGKDVVIFHRGKHVLNTFDHEMTKKLVEITKDLGVEVHVGTEVESITKSSNGYQLKVRKFDHMHEFTSDLVVHGAGRSPNIDGLDLANAGVKVSDRGVIVNGNQQSVSQPHIYAAGDVADDGLPPLTPVAGKTAARLVQHLIHEKEEKSLSQIVPSIVFTYPKLAKVGLTQEEAGEKKIPYEVQSKDISSFFSYKRTESHNAYVKILTNPGTDEILGAHFLTNSADHLVNLFLIAIEKGMTKKELTSLLWAYPTEESDIPSFF